MTQPPPVADWVTIPDLYRDPFPIYDRLRAEGGVHWVPAVGRYLVTSYELVHETELDQETFSANEEGSLQIRAMGHSMLRRDDPEHYVERMSWQPVLRPGAVRKTWTAVFERNAERFLDEMAEKGRGADFIWDFAAPYAAENLREVIGFYNVDQIDLQRWSQTMIDATGNYADDSTVWEKGRRSFEEVDVALDEMIAWHSEHPDHSLISSLLAVPEARLPMERIRANIKMTIGGGLNEPRDALGVAVWALLEHPAQLAEVRRDPGGWSRAFEEGLRWIAPIGLYSRQLTRDTVLGGVLLPAKARLGICVLSANRDEKVWENAATFDPSREVKPHLAFGKGVHVCLGAWVAKAQVAAVGMPAVFERLPGLRLDPQNPTELGGWVFRGVTKMPVLWDVSTFDSPALSLESAGLRNRPTVQNLSIAIVGAGPAGLFSAQALRARFPGSSIDVFEALPVPHGLLSFGVAPDHQGTKAVARQWDRLFTEDGVRFHGNVHIGDDIRMGDLRQSFDVVVVATGLHADIPLDVPGGDAFDVVGAGRLTRVLNSHPTEGGSHVDLGSDVVVIGSGNVAMDVVRLLARAPSEFNGTDLDAETHATVAGRVRTIHVVSRSQPQLAKFDPVMVRELSTLSGVGHQVHGADLDVASRGKDARVDAVRALRSNAPEPARVQVAWWFGFAPVAIETGYDDRVESVVMRDATGESVTVAASAVVTAIGFRAGADDVTIADSTELREHGRVEPGLYAAGWRRRGPRGTIPDLRSDSRELARTIALDAHDGHFDIASKRQIHLPSHATDFEGWLRIDLTERAAAPTGRIRKKLATVDEMLAAARSDLRVTVAASPSSSPSAIQTGRSHPPITILFGTESGNAELIAQDVRRRVGPDDVILLDLADAAAELDSSRLHLIFCSTYGDGELPTSARPFHRALLEKRPPLESLRYGVFGLGDRSYTRTYSRGSEILDETLTELGATRLGEYGRHDAGGALDASQAAIEWAEGVLALDAELSRAP